MPDYVDSLGSGFLGLQFYRALDLLDREGGALLSHNGLDFPSRLSSTLMALHQNAPLSITELGKFLDMPHQLAAQRVAHLKKLGHIREYPDPGDGRRILLQLSEYGQEQVTKLHDVAQNASAAFQEIFQEIGVDLFAAIVDFRAALGRHSLVERTAINNQQKAPDHAR